MLVATALILLTIVFIQAPPLIISKKWWDLAVFLAFWGGSSGYALLVVMNAPIPNVTEVIIAITEFGLNLVTGN